MMQTSAALKTIKKKLVRKVLDLIKKWSDDELKCRKAEAGEEGEWCVVCVLCCFCVVFSAVFVCLRAYVSVCNCPKICL